MRRRSRPWGAAALAMLLALFAATPASAHTLDGNVDAPLPLVAYLLGGAIAVALSFAFVAIGDSSPVPEREPGPVRTLPRWLRLAVRLVGLATWTWVVLQAIVGGSSDAEVASLLLWVFGWIGLALVSALLGPVWSWLDPFSTLYDIGSAIGRRLRIGLPGRAPWHRNTKAWPAVILMGAFVWLELAGQIDDGRELGIVLVGYTLIAVGGMAWYGRDRWRAHGEVFSVWFGLLGRLAPWALAGAPEDGRFRRQGFGRGLMTQPWSASLLVVVALATGAVIWDGISQTQPFYDAFGEPGLALATILLAAFLVALSGLVLAAAQRVGLMAMGAGLVPVAVGYLVAHYLAYLLTEGQRIVVALSDPLQQGWDLLGTATWEPREDWLAGSLIWTIQVTAVVIGHVVGAWMGHSAVRQERREGRTVSQWPLAALMIAMTMLALWSLGQNLVFMSEAAAAATVVVSDPLRW